MSAEDSGGSLDRAPFLAALEELDALRESQRDAARARRAALLERVRSAGPCYLRELPGNRRSGQFSRDIVALTRAGAIHLRGRGEETMVAADPRLLLPLEDASKLPMFEVGNGDRRDDCAHYEGCLDRFLAVWGSSRFEKPARCPKGCAHFEVVPAHVRLELARASVVKSRDGSEPSDEEEAD